MVARQLYLPFTNMVLLTDEIDMFTCSENVWIIKSTQLYSTPNDFFPNRRTSRRCGRVRARVEFMLQYITFYKSYNYIRAYTFPFSRRDVYRMTFICPEISIIHANYGLLLKAEYVP